MSRQADEKRLSKATTPQQKASTAKRGLKTFNPTPTEKGQIRAIDLRFEDILATVASYCEDGSGLSIGYDQTSLVYYLIIRKKTEDWQSAPAISCWHKDPAMTFAMMWYALTVKWPHFPEHWGEATEEEYEW